MQSLVKAVIFDKQQFKQFSHSTYRSHPHIQTRYKRNKWLDVLLKESGLNDHGCFNRHPKYYFDIEQLQTTFKLETEKVSKALCDAKYDMRQFTNNARHPTFIKAPFAFLEELHDEFQNLSNCSEAEIKARVMTLCAKEPSIALPPQAVYELLMILREEEQPVRFSLDTGGW